MAKRYRKHSPRAIHENTIQKEDHRNLNYPAKEMQLSTPIVDLEQGKKNAAAMLRLGRHYSAIKIYTSLASTYPEASAQIHSNISSVYAGINRPADQLKHLEIAKRLDPDNPDILINDAAYLFSAGELEESKAQLLRALELSPHSALALTNLGILELHEGNYTKARSCLEKAISIDHNNRPAVSALISLAERQGKEKINAQYIKQKYKDLPLSLINSSLSVYYSKYDQPLEAICCLDNAIHAEPNDLDLLHQKAKLLFSLGRADEAIELLLVARTIEPENVNTMVLMGLYLQNIGDSASAASLYQEVLSLEDYHSNASNLMGWYYMAKDPYQAEIIYRKALEWDPLNLDIRVNLASVLRDINQIEESLELSREVLAEFPVDETAFYNYMFSLSTLNSSFIETSIKSAKTFWRLYRERASQTSHPIQEKARDLDQSGDSSHSHDTRLSIAILSAEIGNHVVGMFLRSFLENYNKDNLKLTVITGKRRYEEEEFSLSVLAEETLSIQGLSDREASELIKRKGFDVIIDTSGYTDSTQIRLLSDRLAPVQCHYIGYHATTGLDTIDYFIGDRHLIPIEHEEQFTEKIWRLPHCWLAVTYPNHPPRAASQCQTDRFVFGSFNQAAKFNAETFDYWAEALKGVPDSVFLIKDRSMATSQRRETIMIELEKRGIHQSRLYFVDAVANWSEHMDIYNVVDACLDCTPWSGATTVFDSLSMGTPYIAIKGDRTSARMSTSILLDYGHGEWIAESIEDFGRIARELSQSQHELRRLKTNRQRDFLNKSNKKARALASNLQESLEKMRLLAEN